MVLLLGFLYLRSVERKRLRVHWQQRFGETGAQTRPTRTIDQANKGLSLHSSSNHWQQYLHAVYSYSIQLYKIVSLQKNAQQACHRWHNLGLFARPFLQNDVANARVVFCVRQSEGRGTQAARPRGCQVYGEHYK